jgi:uncharacterized protein YbjT (DUF2867 family)
VAGADRQDSGGGGLSAVAAGEGAALRVLIAGATGLIGAQMLELLQRARPQSRVDLLLRRPLAAPGAAAVAESALAPAAPQPTAFAADPLSAAFALWRQAGRGCDVLLCALGTTRRAAGSLQAFVAVDRDLVLEVAAGGRAAGARQAIVVSSVGADADARNDYLRTKGEMEQGLIQLGFERLDLLRPGLLLGARSGPWRPAERLGQWLAPLYNPLLRGGMRDYRAIESRDVARAAIELIGRRQQGVHRHRHRELGALAAGAA